MDSVAIVPVVFNRDQEYFRSSFNGISLLRSQMNDLVRRDDFFIIKEPKLNARDLTIGDIVGKVLEIQPEGMFNINLKVQLFKSCQTPSSDIKLKIQGFFHQHCKLVSYSSYELTCVSLSKPKRKKQL